MRLLRLIPILLSASVFGSTGDIVGVSIETNGWQALVYVAGLMTNASYSFGLGANNSIAGSEKLMISVVSQGFDDTGSAAPILRKVYGTKQVRKPYPNHGSADEVYDSGTNRLRIALSDYVYAGDSNLTATIVSGLYSNSLSAASVPVTNLSTASYQPVIAAWSWPGYQRITNSTFPLRAVAFHRDAQQGRSVRAVKFIATDEHSNSTTSIVTQSTVDRSIGDAVPVVEWVASMSAASLTALDRITCRFIAYPWVGTTNQVWDTSTKSGTQPTPYGVNQINWCDKSYTYGTTIAVVSTNGNNTTGSAVSTTYWATNAAPPEFATIHGAANAIAATNNAVRSRNDVGGGIIYVKAGGHAWTGGSISAGTTPNTWVTITPYPGVSTANCKITSQSGSVDITDRVLVRGMRIETSAALVFYSMLAGWFDQCQIAASGSATWDDVSCYWFTRNSIETIAQGLRPPSGDNAPFALVRGNTVQSLGSANGQAYCTIGNDYSVTTTTTIVADNYAGQNSPTCDWPIFSFNRVMKFPSSGPAAYFGVVKTNILGAAIVQNVFESVNGVQNIVSLAESSKDDWNNVLLWGNTIVGERINMAYNDSGTTTVPVRYWSLAGNYIDATAIKTDTFTTPSGNRTGNWGVVWGVGNEGNTCPEVTGLGANGAFPHEFIGLSSFQTAGGVTTTNTYPLFVNRMSQTGVATNTGGGDYRLNSGSPLFQNSAWKISHDIDGLPRGASDPSGAYSSGNLRKSFF